MNRRMTLGPLDNQMNRQAPPSAARSRMSLGPRASMGPARMQKSASQSQQLVQDMNGLSLQSASQPDRRQSTVGRPSVSSAFGRPSMAANFNQQSGNGSGGIMKDPRNIRDKQWMMAAIRNLVKFLAEAGYDRNISPKIFVSPSAKDFQNIFKYLYAKLDPSFDWKNKKFEEEVPVLLKGLKYPFADQVTKSHLYSVGTMHAWPVLLATLVWMVELIMCCDLIETNSECDENVNQRPDQIFHAFLLRTYNQFLLGRDDFEGMEMELAENFRFKDEWTLKEVERLKQENERMTEEYSRLSSEPSPLSVYTEERVSFTEDIVKVKKWIESLGNKRNQLAEQIEVLNQDISHKQTLIDETQREKNELQEIVDSQELSPVDVDRMNAERDQLNKNLESFSEKIEEINKVIWEREIHCQKKGDEVEKLVHEFNNKAYRLDLIPASASNAEGLQFELSLNHQSNRAEEIITSDLRGTLKRALHNLRQSFKNRALANEDRLLASKEAFEQVMEKTLEKLDEIKAVEVRLALLQERYDGEKQDLEMSNRVKQDEIENIERQLRKSKVENTRDLLDAQKSAREFQLEYENLVRRTTDQKERLVKETLKALNDLVEMKTQFAERLTALQTRLNENFAL